MTSPEGGAVVREIFAFPGARHSHFLSVGVLGCPCGRREMIIQGPLGASPDGSVLMHSRCLLERILIERRNPRRPRAPSRSSSSSADRDSSATRFCRSTIVPRSSVIGRVLVGFLWPATCSAVGVAVTLFNRLHSPCPVISKSLGRLPHALTQHRIRDAGPHPTTTHGKPSSRLRIRSGAGSDAGRQGLTRASGSVRAWGAIPPGYSTLEQ